MRHSGTNKDKAFPLLQKGENYRGLGEEKQMNKQVKGFEVKEERSMKNIVKKIEDRINQKLTQQTKNRLKKYQIEKKDNYVKQNGRLKTIFFQLIFFCLYSITIDRGQNVIGEKAQTIDYLHYQTSPLPEESTLDDFWKIALCLIIKNIDSIMLFLICQVFIKFQDIYDKKRRILIIFVPQLIKLISVLPLYFDSLFGNVGNQLISLFFKILSINIFFLAFIKFGKIKIENRKKFFNLFVLTSSSFTLLCTLALKYLNNLNCTDFSQISILAPLMFYLLLISQYLICAKYYWEVKRIQNTKINTETIEIMQFYQKVSFFNVILFNICLFFQQDNNKIILPLYGDQNLIVKQFGLTILLGYGIQVITIFAKKILIQRRTKYIFQISQSLFSSNNCDLKDNQLIQTGECFLCLSEPARFLFEGCGHLYCGNNCVLSCLERGGNLCPICRKPSSNLIEIWRVKDQRSNRKFEILNRYMKKII